jgi:hypothetical protein
MCTYRTYVPYIKWVLIKRNHDAAADRVRKYRADYKNRPPSAVSPTLIYTSYL